MIFLRVGDRSFFVALKGVEFKLGYDIAYLISKSAVQYMKHFIYHFTWCRIVAPKMAGEGRSPKTSLVNLRRMIFGLSALASSNHKNRRKS